VVASSRATALAVIATAPLPNMFGSARLADALLAVPKMILALWLIVKGFDPPGKRMALPSMRPRRWWQRGT